MKTKMIFLTLFLTSGVVSLRAGQSDFKSYINGTSYAPTTHDTWGVFLGLTQSDSNIDDYIREQISLGKWINPFTGQPLPSKRGVFVFGQDNPALELLRGITDHL